MSSPPTTRRSLVKPSAGIVGRGAPVTSGMSVPGNGAKSSMSGWSGTLTRNGSLGLPVPIPLLRCPLGMELRAIVQRQLGCAGGVIRLMLNGLSNGWVCPLSGAQIVQTSNGPVCHTLRAVRLLMRPFSAA